MFHSLNLRHSQCFFSILMYCLLAEGEKGKLKKKLQKIISPHPYPLLRSGVVLKDNKGN